jgi:ABC-type multidrug transport system fused ATPase/permease subunit
MDATKNQIYIDAYYKTNQAHVKWSFWASLIALAIGLVVLVIGIGLALAGSSTAVSTTTTAAGVLTQFISAGFFFIYSKNLKQLNVFYDKLIRNQDTLFAFGLVGHIPEAERPGVIQAIIGALLSRSGPSTELTPELVKALADAKQSGARH